MFFNEDPQIIGAPFYIMEKVNGEILDRLHRPIRKTFAPENLKPFRTWGSLPL